MLLEKIFIFTKIILVSTSPSSCVPCNCFGNFHTFICDSTVENEKWLLVMTLHEVDAESTIREGS
jgi:hypothetical protein